MKCRCLATAPFECWRPAGATALCGWCLRDKSLDHKRKHQRNAIAAIWCATWRRRKGFPRAAPSVVPHPPQSPTAEGAAHVESGAPPARAETDR